MIGSIHSPCCLVMRKEFMFEKLLRDLVASIPRNEVMNPKMCKAYLAASRFLEDTDHAAAKTTKKKSGRGKKQ